MTDTKKDIIRLTYCHRVVIKDGKTGFLYLDPKGEDAIFGKGRKSSTGIVGAIYTFEFVDKGEDGFSVYTNTRKWTGDHHLDKADIAEWEAKEDFFHQEEQLKSMERKAKAKDVLHESLEKSGIGPTYRRLSGAQRRAYELRLIYLLRKPL
jgi:hypothetical protein